MSKKYGIFCENCNVLLNNEDDNIFGSNFGQLYHSTCVGGINHGKTADCQPLTLFKMNLKFGDTPTLLTEAKGECGHSNNVARQYVQQLKAKIKTLEEALRVQDRLKDDVNNLMDCIVKLENTLSINVDTAVNNISQDKSNKQACDENNFNGDDSPVTGKAEEQNIEHNNSNDGLLQLAARLETLKLQKKSDGNKLKDCVETAEKSKTADNAPDGGNNITQDSNANKQTRNESNLSGEQHNDTGNVASTSEEHHTYTISEEELEVVDLRRYCVYIRYPKAYIKGLDNAFSYVRKLAKKMKARIADNSIIHIDRKNYPNWYVYFRDADSKIEFLNNRLIFKYNPKTKGREDCLRILDYSDCGIVDIKNFQSSDLSLDTAFVNVFGLAKKVGMTNIRDFIDHIDVYSTEPNILTYSVRFNCQDKKNVFLQKKDILKEFPETKSLEISDVGGHTSSKNNVNNFSMAANVIGFAELIGLSLSTNNFKRIYVLNTKEFDSNTRKVLTSLVVEFSSNDIKSNFLEEYSKLNPANNTWSSYISISDIATKGGNIISIKYDKYSNYIFTATSFIGLAKQLGFSFTSDQTERFIQLSQFILNASS